VDHVQRVEEPRKVEGALEAVEDEDKERLLGRDGPCRVACKSQ
jgi:hypothetical protein